MRKLNILFYLLTTLLLISCKQDIVKKNSPRSVFEVFWQVMDERYVYFEEKNLNWDSIYNAYYPKINDNTTDEELKGYFQEIINYIKDGHVFITVDQEEIISYNFYDKSDDDFHILRNRPWKGYWNKSDIIGTEGSLMAQVGEGILYIRISTFRTEPHLEDLFSNIENYNYQDGIIIDIASNGGGRSLYLREWISLFFEGKKTFLYKKNKTGKAHTDFSGYQPVDFEGQGYFSDTIPIALITSGQTYSAGTFFTAIMKELPNCRIFGEATSGGGGGRATIILPNNWLFSFTIEKFYDINKYSLEEGVQPDTVVIGSVTIYEDGTVETSDLVMDASINYLLTKNKSTN